MSRFLIPLTSIRPSSLAVICIYFSRFSNTPYRPFCLLSLLLTNCSIVDRCSLQLPQVNQLLNDAVSMKALPPLPAFRLKVVRNALSNFNSTCEQFLVPSPPRISQKKLEKHMDGAFAPFKEFVEKLARGYLDGLLDSIHHETNLSVPGIFIPTDKQLLLHQLGERSDMRRIDELFVPTTVFVIFWSASMTTANPPSVTFTVFLVQEKPVFLLMASAFIGGFISRAGATVF
jgi:hypothetical protein